MQRRVGHRVELDVARQHADARAFDAEFVEAAEKPAAFVFARERAPVERHRPRFAAAAIDDRGDAPGAPGRARAALAAGLPRGRFQNRCVGHVVLLKVSARAPAPGRTGSRPSSPR